MEMLREISIVSVIVRMLLSVVIGGILGFERGKKNRPAGLRTYMLVCVGACLVMMTNQYVYENIAGSDPVRMGAQVISGIGFLGAGTIIITGKKQVKGITTAAGLWASACLGLAIGIGFYEGAIAGGLTVFIVISLMQKLDSQIHKSSRVSEAYIELEKGATLRAFIEYTRNNNMDISDLQIHKEKGAKNPYTSIILTVYSKSPVKNNETIEKLGEAPGVVYIEEL